MMGFRQLHTRMWSADSWFSSLKPDMKLLYIYLFSNERTSVCGLYEIPIRIMSFETGLDRTQIDTTLKFFIAADKIKYDFERGVIWVKNMWKYQGSASPKLEARVKADIHSVPDCELKKEVVAALSDTVSIPYSNGKDTPISVSVSVSDSVSIKDSYDSKAAEIIAMATNSNNNYVHREEKLYQQVTGQACIPPAHLTEIYTSLQALLDYYGTNWTRAVEEGKDIFATWCNTIGKNGHKYGALNPAWLGKWLEKIAPVPDNPHASSMDVILDAMRKEMEAAQQR